MSAERTLESIEVANLVRLASVTAEKLERVAKEIRRHAEYFAKTDLRGGATGVAADIVNDYVQGIGSPGTFLWTIVRDAAELDARRKAQVSA